MTPDNLSRMRALLARSKRQDMRYSAAQWKITIDTYTQGETE